MESMRDIKRRINSIKNTQKITNAMKMVAAAKLRRSQEMAERARPFSIKPGRLFMMYPSIPMIIPNTLYFLIKAGKGIFILL